MWPVDDPYISSVLIENYFSIQLVDSSETWVREIGIVVLYEGAARTLRFMSLVVASTPCKHPIYLSLTHLTGIFKLLTPRLMWDPSGLLLYIAPESLVDFPHSWSSKVGSALLISCSASAVAMNLELECSVSAGPATVWTWDSGMSDSFILQRVLRSLQDVFMAASSATDVIVSAESNPAANPSQLCWTLPNFSSTKPHFKSARLDYPSCKFVFSKIFNIMENIQNISWHKCRRFIFLYTKFCLH